MRQLQLNHVRCAAALLLAAILTPTATAATFVVSSAVDNAVSPNLRRAISDANASPGPDVIVFEFPGYPVTLTFSSPLPDIIDSVVIDGTDPSGCLAGAVPRIQLDGIGLGPNANGLAARGTAAQPIRVTIKGLAVYRFPGTGILLEYNTNSVIVGNHVGINAAGNFPLPNGAGLVLDNCDDVIVGGTAPCQRNVMSGNQRGGLEIYQGAGHQVINNLVGLSANGQWAVPNQVGVALHFGQQCQIGSLLPGEGNVISRNLQEGVLVTGGLGVPMESRIEGNFIGTLAGGSFPAPNGGDGVHFLGGPTRNHVRGNVIAHNGGSGVMVLEGIDNEIVENSIFSNTLLGIDISPRFAPNPNDPCDADEGPNRQQNFPMLGFALSSASSVQIDGTLDSEPGKTYRLDFYWSPACDAFGFGEGRHHIGHATVSSPSAGQCVTPFNVSFPVAVPPGVAVTATATHPEGSTSEFSLCTPVLAGGSNIVHHAGLPHEGGSGVPVPCPEGYSGSNPCDLTVPGDAASRTASVRIGLGRVTGWQGDLQDVLLRDFGDSFKLELEHGTEDGTEPTPPSPASNEIFEAAKDYFIEANIPQPSLFIRALTNGSMSLQFTLVDAQDNEVYSNVPQPDSFRLLLNSSNDVVDINQASYLQLPNGERALRLEFRNPLLVAVPAVQGNFATHAIIVVCRKLNPATGQSLPPPATITSARLTFRRESPTAGTPLSFRLGEELLQQFGQLHGALNNSMLAGWHWSQGGTGDPARVTFPASTIYGGFPRDASGALTEGGVMLRLDPARYICVDLDWDLVGSATPFLAAAGSPVIALPYFRLMIGTNHVLPPSPDAVLVQRNERDWSIAPSFGTSGAASNRYEFYRYGALVGGSDTSTANVLRASSAPLRLAHSTSVSPAGALGFKLIWREAANFVLLGTPGVPGDSFEADELRIIPLNPTQPLRSFTRIDISGAGLPWLEITGEDWRSSRVGRVMVQKVRDGEELSAPTEAGRPYQLEFTPNLNAREWQTIDSFSGDGSVRKWPVRESPSRPPQGFYRLGGF